MNTVCGPQREHEQPNTLEAKPDDVSRTSTNNEGTELMQQRCNTNAGLKAMFSHRTAYEGPKQTFSDICTSERPKAAHAAEPVKRTGIPPYLRRTVVSPMRQQHLCPMGPHFSFKRNPRGVLCLHEGNTELSTYP